MTQAAAPPQTDRDLASIAEARALARRAKHAWLELAEFNQEKIDAIVDAMAAAATTQAEALAQLAVDETGYGVVADKVQKNLFSSQKVYAFIKGMKTVGVIARDEDRRVIEIAEPFGVVAAVIPSTNPTSTAIYKILISLKARCAVVLSPHPAAVKCITRVAEVMEEAARRAGAPAGAINWMTTVTLEGTQELMKHRDVAVILATGGMGLVRAAYSAGKPAYGAGRHSRSPRAARRRRPRLPAVDRKALPGPFLLCGEGLARGLRAVQTDPAVRRDGPHHGHPLAERSGDPRIRAQETGVSHRRE